MLCLFTLGLWQLIIGTATVSVANQLDTSALRLLNLVCVLGGAAGVVAALIPERVLKRRFTVWRWATGFDFDATYFRLWEEFGAQLMLFTVWLSYGQTVWATLGFVKGYSFGLAAAVWFGIAALWRAIEILLTLYRAGTFRRRPTAIVGNDTIDEL
jgi:hypothetical protein